MKDKDMDTGPEQEQCHTQTDRVRLIELLPTEVKVIYRAKSDNHNTTGEDNRAGGEGSRASRWEECRKIKESGKESYQKGAPFSSRGKAKQTMKTVKDEGLADIDRWAADADVDRSVKSFISYQYHARRMCKCTWLDGNERGSWARRHQKTF